MAVNEPILNNRRDPLLSATTVTEQELLKKLGAVCTGCSYEMVIKVAFWLFMNAIRQKAGVRNQAEALYDETVGKGKGFLLDHYDPVTGRRKPIFSFTQYIQMPLHVDKDKIRG